MLRFKPSVLLGTSTLLDKLLRVLQLPIHLSDLTTNEEKLNSWLYSLECKLKRVGWIIHFWLLKDMHFAWLDSLTRSVNIPISIFFVNPNTILCYLFLTNPNIILYDVFFIKDLWISKISLVSIELKSTEKKFALPFNPVIFTLLVVKSFGILH